MNVCVVSVGKPKGTLATAISEYEARAGRYWKLQTTTVNAGAPGRTATAQSVRHAEGERILGALPATGEVVALTRDGKSGNSRWLARFLEERAIRSTPNVTFIIGGAFGLDDAVLERATRLLSLSGMTLPHDLARLVLGEQLYRAGTILRNEPYHKGTAG